MSGKVAGLLALSKLVEVEGQSKAKKVCVNYDENDWKLDTVTEWFGFIAKSDETKAQRLDDTEAGNVLWWLR